MHLFFYILITEKHDIGTNRGTRFNGIIINPVIIEGRINTWIVFH